MFRITSLILLLFAASAAAGQILTNFPTVEQRRAADERARRNEGARIADSMAALDGLRNANQVYRTLLKKKELSKNDRELRAGLTAPDRDDAALYADFLKQSDTGILRLFSDRGCRPDNLIKADPKCANIFPGTWSYSFRAKDYAEDLFGDILLRNGRLTTDGFLAQGMIVRLGNFSLDRVTSASPGAKFPADFKPADKIAEVRAQYEQLRIGVDADGFLYSKEAPAKVGSVYLLRVIAYRLHLSVLTRILRSKTEPDEDDLNFIRVDQDTRKDVTIAFRIVRQDADKNLTIVWKELDRKKSPEIVFAD
ncbi:MAG: hypothetical protein JSS81_13450 [Acidobacteria bacterium]|nr:hypothetical protein [Acidobacteriota bacterium]